MMTSPTTRSNQPSPPPTTIQQIPVINLTSAKWNKDGERTTKTVSGSNDDNIFILEPDADSPIDYNDILSQIFFSSPQSQSLSTPPSSYSSSSSSLSASRNSDMMGFNSAISDFKHRCCYSLLFRPSFVLLVLVLVFAMLTS